MASTAPYGGLDVEREHTWLEPYIGESNQPYAVVVTGHGTQVPAITSVAVVPPVSGRPSHVEIHGTDTCSGTTLTDQETCSVTVDAAPWDQTRETVKDPLRLETSTGSSTTTLTNRLGPLPSRRGLFADAVGRRMDTRTGLGVRKGVVGAGKSVTLKLTGGAVPEVGTASAVLNLTVTGSTSAGYVTAYPAGTPRPTVSSINFPRGWTGANLVTVPLGADGSVTFFNRAGTVHLVADLVGVYASGRTWTRDGSDYHPQTPTRLFDSRTAGGKPLGPNAVVTLPVDYGSAVNARVRGVVLNVTVTGPTGTGYVSAVGVQPTGPPPTSTLNYTRGLTAANMAVVPVTGTGTQARQVFIANVGSSSTHVVVDVVGYFADFLSTEPGLRYRALSPTRVVDTRSDLGLASVGAGVAKRVQAPVAVAGRDTAALVANLTGVLPSADTHLTVWDTGVLPQVSNLNLMKGVTRANSIWPGLDATNGFRVQNAVGSVGALVDVTGSFERFPPSLQTLAGVPYPAAG